jgi:hypothetical protein
MTTVNAAQQNTGFPVEGADWTEQHWHSLLEQLISQGIVSWREVTSTVLGGINPSQVGTSMTKDSFKRRYEPRKCWSAVRAWHFMQSGVCADCGTRMDLQADHAIPKEFVGGVGVAIARLFPDIKQQERDEVLGAIKNQLNGLLVQHGYSGILDELSDSIVNDLYAALLSGETEYTELAYVADRVDNMILRCRRHNVIRRPSHANGGVTFLTAEAGLMWLLFVHRPKNYTQFADLCRQYGMTMANIRFEEGWAMARWLNQAGLYEIDPSCKYAPQPVLPLNSSS